MDIGDMDTCCVDCGALIWYEERVEKQRGKVSLKISLCCKKGKITIPFDYGMASAPVCRRVIIHTLRIE
jgi:hypothetical protein